MFNFIKKLFKAKPAEALDAIVEEYFETDFTKARQARFQEEEDERYTAGLSGGKLELRLKRERLFAWAENPIHRYSDFIAEADICFAEGQADTGPKGDPKRDISAAAGLLFRYADEGHFYLVMLSDSGHLRLDLIFNGSPRTLIAWTETGFDPAPRVILTVIARGPHICLLVNNQWVAETEDDSFDCGYLAFGAENFGRPEGLVACLESFMVDSRPVEVETAYERALNPAFLKPRARKALAETFLSMGQALPAVIHLRKMAGITELSIDERFLLAEAQLRCGLLDEALAEIEKILHIDPEHRAAAAEKANILYLQGRYGDLKALLEAILPERDAEATLWNLLGHAHFNLGEFPAAAAAYLKAADIDPDQGIYALNAARSFDSGAMEAEAAPAYIRAGRAFFAADQLDDLELVLRRLGDISPSSAELAALKAKFDYREGKAEQARPVFESLIEKGEADASIFYLEGLILRQAGQSALAIEHLRQACRLEPSFPLYRFRLAEAIHLDGDDACAEIEDALALAPNDGWILNLAGQYQTERGDLKAARDFLSRAIAALPGELAPFINLSALLLREGEAQAAVECLAPYPEAAAARNQAGNAYAASGDLESALKEYNAAVRLAPEDIDFRLNRAACLLELDSFSDAETDIRVVLEKREEGRAYLLMGRIASIYGDYPRAELAFRLALEKSPKDLALQAGLADIYLESRKLSKAEEIIEGMESRNHPQAVIYRERLLALSHDSLSCTICQRRWLVPKDIPSQGQLRISGELPDHSPAGSCPQCGKLYCVGCRKDQLENDRLVCPSCHLPLKLGEDRVKYLLRKSLGGAS